MCLICKSVCVVLSRFVKLYVYFIMNIDVKQDDTSNKTIAYAKPDKIKVQH